VGECFFWYWLTRVVPDEIHRAVKRLCVCVCVDLADWVAKYGVYLHAYADDSQVWAFHFCRNEIVSSIDQTGALYSGHRPMDVPQQTESQH